MVIYAHRFFASCNAFMTTHCLRMLVPFRQRNGVNESFVDIVNLYLEGIMWTGIINLIRIARRTQ